MEKAMKSYIQALAVERENTQKELKRYFADALINVDVRWADFELAVNSGVYINHTLMAPSRNLFQVADDLWIDDRVDLIGLVSNYADEESASNILALKREILSFGYTSFG
jgi:hypothetical protein